MQTTNRIASARASGTPGSLEGMNRASPALSAVRETESAGPMMPMEPIARLTGPPYWSAGVSVKVAAVEHEEVGGYHGPSHGSQHPVYCVDVYIDNKKQSHSKVRPCMGGLG